MFSTLEPQEPMMMVHRGWQETTGEENGYWTGPTSKSSGKSRRNTEPSVAAAPKTTQTFEFVNEGTTAGREKDPNVRKLVRAHVVRDWSRRKKLQRLQMEKLKGRPIEPGYQVRTSNGTMEDYVPMPQRKQNSRAPRRATESLRTPLPSPQRYEPIEVDSDPFDDVEDIPIIMESPIEMTSQMAQYTKLRRLLLFQPDPDPQMSPILYHIRTMGVAMFPLVSKFKFNPLCPDGCVGWHLNDKAVYHSILYTTTSYANLISGVPDGKDALMHVAKTVAMVNKRLKEINDAGNGKGIDEGIIGAVACIALTEALKGNIAGWRLHMSGVKHLCSMNRGISKLTTNLRFKLYRADLQGAIGFLASPFFSGAEAPYILFPHTQSYPGAWSPISPTNDSIQHLLAPLPISQDLIDALFSMSDLSSMITDVVSTRAACDLSQQATVLDQSYSIQYSLLKPWAGKWIKDMNPVEEVLRVAGLLYMHAIWQDFPFAALGASTLIQRLKELVMVIQLGNEDAEALVIWMLFMGAITAGKGDSRIWFIAHLQRLTDELELEVWEVVKKKLVGLWWVDGIHGKLCKAVWDEVVVLDSVLVGDQSD